MNILTRWGFRTARANRVRTITVILAVVGFFALTTSASFVMNITTHSFHRTLAIFLSSLYAARPELHLFLFLYLCMLIVTAAVLFIAFSVTADECARNFHILTSVGATVRQIRRSLLQRALALSVGGAAGGVPLGLLLARLLLDADAFSTELSRYYFRDFSTILMLSAGILLPPCLMALASAIALRRKASNRRTRTPKHRLFRRSVTRRVFGAGGVLGCMSSNANRRYRAIFTASFAACLAVLALLNNSLMFFSGLRTLQEDYDLQVSCFDLEQDTASVETVLDELLRENADRFGVKKAVSYIEAPVHLSGYYYLDDELLSDAYRTGTGAYKSETGRSALRFFGDYLFLDDASFALLARENGIDPDEDGALFFGMVRSGDRLVPMLQPRESYPDVTLHFLPDDFVFALEGEDLPEITLQNILQYQQLLYRPIMLTDDAAAFQREADPVSVTKSFRILGCVQSLPFEYNSRALIFPERMYPAFAKILSDLPIRKFSQLQGYDSLKLFYLKLSDPAAGIEAFKQSVASCPHLIASVREGLSEQNFQYITDVPYEDALASLQIYNLYARRQQLQQIQTLVPQLQILLFLTAAWILFVGILNTAHMNRSTRRHENAVLESIGMGGRQKAGMLLYESARYALCSALLGCLGFAAGYACTRGYILLMANTSDLHEQGAHVITKLYSTAESQATLLQEIAQICARTWWVFVGGAALIFALLVVTDKFIERRSKREELIQILTDDSQQTEFDL